MGEKISGYRREELMGQPLSKLVCPEYLPVIFDRLKARAHGGEVEYTYEIEIFNKNGERVPLEITTNLITRDGRPIGSQVIVRDITKRKRLEKALRESEEKYRTLVESSSDAIFTIDTQGNFTFFNENVKNLIGFTSGELVGMNFVEILPPESQKKAKKFFSRGMKGEEGHTYELEVYKKGGGTAIVELNMSTLFQDGKPIGRLGIARDITERKRAEEALQYRVELENLITTISTNFINLAPDEIDSGINNALQEIGEFAGVDRSYVFLFCDTRAKMDNTHEWCAEGIEPQIDNLKGLSVEAFPWWMERLNRFETIHIPRVADLPSEASVEKEILQSQAIQSLVVVPMVYGGSLIGFLGFDSVRVEKTWAEEDISLLKMVGEIFVNALERKRAEEAIKRLSAAVESMKEYFTIADMDGKIVYANPALERDYGYPKEELLGKHASILLSPDSPPELAEGICKATLGGGWTGEIRNIAKDGRVFWVDMSTALLKDKSGKPANIIAIARDITDRKKMEVKLEEKIKELERFNRLAVGRELKMIELKKRIRALEKSK
jgi:PAS domain S-box-containing protein